MADITYYFDAYDEGGQEWTTTPQYAVDNILTNYASTTVDGQKEKLTLNTCPGTNLGTITKVEFRAYAYGDVNDQLRLTPIFDTLEDFPINTVPGLTPAWGAYQDITNVGYAPSPWTWADVVTLRCLIELNDVSKGNTMYCAKVEIRVTYWAPPVADIDVGAEPLDRTTQVSDSFTYIDKNNPANASGTLHSVKVYAYANITGLRVGTFYITNGNTLKCRDSELVGDIEAGAERTFNGLSIDVQAGDYIGCYFTGGNVEADGSGYDGIWYISGEYIDPNDEATYGTLADRAMSLYGYGDFAVTPPRHGFVNFQDPGIL